jgi:heat shock protein HtpX
MMRILLFLGTNLAVLLVMSVAVKLFGVEKMLAQQGVGMNLDGLLIMAAIVGMSGSLVSLAISKWMAKRAVGAQVIEQPQTTTERWLVDTVARQAKAAGIGMPEVAIFPAPEMNAFATGMNRNNALVAVSTGLLEGMRPDEVEAVLGHEIAHVANGDMVTLALVQGVVNTFVFFLSRVVGQLVDRLLFRSDREEGGSFGYGPGYWITTMVAEILLGILATMIVMWFSRYREFRADTGGANLAGREKMIAALERLRRGTGESQMPDTLTAFAISGGRHGLMRFFMSHPPLEDRIAALRAAQS